MPEFAKQQVGALDPTQIEKLDRVAQTCHLSRVGLLEYLVEQVLPTLDHNAVIAWNVRRRQHARAKRKASKLADETN
jgi:hypothetical protein